MTASLLLSTGQSQSMGMTMRKTKNNASAYYKINDVKLDIKLLQNQVERLQQRVQKLEGGEQQ